MIFLKKGINKLRRTIIAAWYKPINKWIDIINRKVIGL